MENELDKLRRVQSPKATDAARERAMAAAMQAYDDQQKTSDATQGLAAGQRQSSIATRIWSSIMNKRLLAGSALATLLIVPAAGYVTIGMLNDGRLQLAEPGTSAEADLDRRRVGLKSDPEPQVAKQETEKRDDAGAADMTGNVKQAAKAEEDIVLAERNQPGQDAISGAAAREDKPVESDSLADARQRLDNAPDFANEPEAMPSDTLAAAPVTAAEGQAPKKRLGGIVAIDKGRVMLPAESGDRFTSDDVNPVKSVVSEPVSTFSIDVDTASYAYARSAILSGRLPEPGSVRVEEMINYFPYDWKPPHNTDHPFRANVTVMPTPWNTHTQLMHIGIKGYEMQVREQRPANLVFLIDVSGSMDAPDKLPLLKSAFRLLVNTLKPDDTVSIVVYAGSSGIVLEPTKISERQKILDAIDNLTPGGSTAGAEGLEAAYRLAQKSFAKDGVNRIFLATDGDFNVGPSSDEDLKAMIEARRKSGIFLSVLGFGTGNYNDALMQTLAQNGNGVAAYIDTLSEAQKTLVQEATASLFPIAKDVKIQVEFNPDKIAEYRLIGYETRALKREDFNNDKVDAGEIGSGHQVTAIYEITPKGSPAVLNDDLRYARQKQDSDAGTMQPDVASDELAFVKIRYKKPEEDISQLISMPVTVSDAKAAIDAVPADVRFSVAVAAFGQKLKHEGAVADYGWDAIRALGAGAKGTDAFGYRAEFLKLVDLAGSLKAE